MHSGGSRLHPPTLHVEVNGSSDVESVDIPRQQLTTTTGCTLLCPLPPAFIVAAFVAAFVVAAFVAAFVVAAFVVSAFIVSAFVVAAFIVAAFIVAGFIAAF